MLFNLITASIATIADPLSSDVVQKANQNAESIYVLIKEGRFEELLDKSITWGISFGGKLIFALIIFFIGRWLIRKICNFQNRIFERRQMDVALKGFLKSLTSILLYIVLFLFIINLVGTQTVSLAALIASAGLAIGLAVKDNLSNFAGGVMLLLNKPFKGGDYIEAQNLSGTVNYVGILYTTLTTPENKTIFIPNGPLSTGNIVNYTTQDTRRVDITTGVEYGSDVEFVKKLLIDIASDHPKTLKDPAPFARMVKMNEHSIDFTLRTWVKSGDFWDVTFDLNEEIYNKIHENGLVIPYRQLTVHMAKNADDKQHVNRKQN